MLRGIVSVLQNVTDVKYSVKTIATQASCVYILVCSQVCFCDSEAIPSKMNGSAFSYRCWYLLY